MTKDQLASILGTQPGNRDCCIVRGGGLFAAPVVASERMGFEVGPGIVESQPGDSPKVEILALQNGEEVQTVDDLTDSLIGVAGTLPVLDAALDNVVLLNVSAHVRRMIKRESGIYIEAKPNEPGWQETLVFVSHD